MDIICMSVYHSSQVKTCLKLRLFLCFKYAEGFDDPLTRQTSETPLDCVGT